MFHQCHGVRSHEFTSRRWYAGLPVDISVFFCGCASNSQDLLKPSPRAIFKWKNLIEPLKLLSQWMKCGESWMPTCTNMCHYAPTWANIAVCQLCRERQPLWNSHDGLNLTCLDQCHDAMVFVPVGCTVYHLNLIHEFTSLFSPKVIFAGLARESLPMKIGKGRRWTRVFFCRCASNSQGLPKASPRADRARGRKGDRQTYCMYTAIHIISETDLPNSSSRAQGRAPRALSF